MFTGAKGFTLAQCCDDNELGKRMATWRLCTEAAALQAVPRARATDWIYKQGPGKVGPGYVPPLKLKF